MYTILTVTFVVNYLLTILCTSVLFLFGEHQGLEVSEVFGVELSDWSDTQSIIKDKITSFEVINVLNHIFVALNISCLFKSNI